MRDTQKVTRRFAYPADDEVVEHFFRAQENNSASLRVLIGLFQAEHAGCDVISVVNNKAETNAPLDVEAVMAKICGMEK